jgi:ribosomal protein S18 acetylase RimI-like enzyme
MLTATITSNTDDLRQILSLQERNLIRNLTKDEMKSDGFVTINHSLQMLQQMHNMAPSIIIKDGNRIVAYALTMLREFSTLVPELEPMFEKFESLQWNNRPLNEYPYYVMGQICVDKAYRGKGLFDALYQKHKEVFSSQFDLLVTEIATRNHRSINAHKRVGFMTINTFRDETDEWNVVAWDWMI